MHILHALYARITCTYYCIITAYITALSSNTCTYYMHYMHILHAHITALLLHITAYYCIEQWQSMGLVWRSVPYSKAR